jgi:hypothetical protein
MTVKSFKPLACSSQAQAAGLESGWSAESQAIVSNLQAKFAAARGGGDSNLATRRESGDAVLDGVIDQWLQ